MLKVNKLVLPKDLMCRKVDPLQFLFIVIMIIVVIFIILIGIYSCKAQQPQQDIKAWSYKKKKKEIWKAYKEAFQKEPKDKMCVLTQDLNHSCQRVPNPSIL